MPVVLKFLALIIGLVSMIHVASGISGEVLVGARVPIAIDPVLDSQNRFYGGAFMIYAALLWICSGDIARYRNILRILLIAFFFAGCARGLAVIAYGWPSWQIILLWATELGLPPVLFWRLRR